MKERRYYINGKMRMYAFGMMLFSLFNSPANAQPSNDTLIESPAVDTSAAYSAYDNEEENSDTVFRLPDTIIFRSVPDTAVARLKANKEFEYANSPEYWVKKKENQKESKGLGYFIDWLFGNSAIRVIMYLLLAVIVLYALFRIIVNNDLFYTPSKKRQEVGEALDNEIKDDALDEKINAAIANNEYRNAVRFLYFKTLRGLDAKGWIIYHSQATNFEYLKQVSKYPIASDFGFLTQVYEYAWYGGFELTGDQFGIVYSNFQKIYKVIGV